MVKYEPLDLVEAAFIGHGSVGIFATMILDGRIDVDRLSDSVARVGTLVPETLCCLDAHHMRFTPISSADVIAEVPSLAEAGFTWDPTADTQVKLVVGHGVDADSIVVGMTHVVTDGIGMEQYVSLLAKAYDGKLPNLNNVRSIDSMLSRVKIGEPTRGELLAEKLGEQFLGLPSSGDERMCRCVIIPAETMDAIHAKAKDKGVTLNDIFVAACVRVVARRLHTSAVCLPCPVDLRKLGDMGELTVANMSGIYNTSFAVREGESLSATVESVRGEMAELQGRNRSMADIAKFAPICRASPVRFAEWMVRRNVHMIPAIIYSNFGVLEPLQFGESRAVTYFVTGGYRRNHQIGLNISTYMGATSFVHSLIGDAEGADAAEAVIRDIVEECESWLDL